MNWDYRASRKKYYHWCDLQAAKPCRLLMSFFTKNNGRPSSIDENSNLVSRLKGIKPKKLIIHLLTTIYAFKSVNRKDEDPSQLSKPGWVSSVFKPISWI